MAIVLPFRDVWPDIGRDVFLAPNATITGDVELADEVSIWFGAVIRGDAGSVRIGARTNIQDLVCIHMTTDISHTVIGADVTVGHGAIVHGAIVGDRCLVGMGSILLDNVVVGEEALVAAGAVLKPGTVVPPRTLAAGNPAKVMRDLTPEEAQLGIGGAQHYLERARVYMNICEGDAAVISPRVFRNRD